MTLKNNQGQETAKLTATEASSSLDGSATIHRAALSGTANSSSRLRAAASGTETAESTYAIATMEDGLSFIGDDSTKVDRVLNTQLTLKGGASGTLTDNNIGVRSFTADNGATGFHVQLASDLTNLNSVTSQSVTTNNLTVKGGNSRSKTGPTSTWTRTRSTTLRLVQRRPMRSTSASSAHEHRCPAGIQPG